MTVRPISYPPSRRTSIWDFFRLSDDYLSAVEYTELFKWQSREAPAIVRHGDTYFMMFSACSGWDPNQATFSYSKSLTSGWSSRANIGNSIAYDTQAASVLTVTGSKGTSYVYVGDRWQDPGLAESKTIMFPISLMEIPSYSIISPSLIWICSRGNAGMSRSHATSRKTNGK